MKYIGLALILTMAIGCNNTNNDGESSSDTSNDVDQQGQSEPSSIAPSAFKKGIQDEDALVLDVRTQQEFEQGYIPNAKNVNYRAPDFETLIKQIDRKGSFYVYCASGSRSSKAVDFMAKEGFEEVYNLKGGIFNWQEQGYPVKK